MDYIYALPETREQWLSIKEEFIKNFEIEDSPESWTFILSQIQGTKMPDLAFDMINVFNHYKRWKIGKILQDEKTVYIKQLEDKLREKIAALANTEAGNEGAAPSQDDWIHPIQSSDLPQGAQSIQGDVQGLPTPKEDLVQPSSW